MELQKESLQHPASQRACPRKPGLTQNHRIVRTCGSKRSLAIGDGSHLHRDLNWEKSSQGHVCCSPRKCMCQPSRLNGRATFARVLPRLCGPHVL